MQSSQALKCCIALWLSTVLLFFGSLGFAFLSPPATVESPWRFAGEISGVPANGVPRQVPFYRTSRNAWAWQSDFVGTIFLRRAPLTKKVTALSHFHLSNGHRIALQIDANKGVFRSVCRKVEFDWNGQLLNPDSDPQVRALADDIQQVEVKVERGYVFVHASAQPITSSR